MPLVNQTMFSRRQIVVHSDTPVRDTDMKSLRRRPSRNVVASHNKRG